ncbi:hypothetical protein ONS95_006647 [Cadophora gregata]|uniref:uncharacterized protein n=1 Tax=Cadophora gregata TaxID=51156 RepID=UPI0026DBD0DB|nr:uncharacterized protein ONS95_006647 [Cadophora gregata]KAK0101477.1 hypothetical protein ONS95_006647 [Cadophora gregata]
MMHGTWTSSVVPDDPPPGNPSSMPGWNSQWSLEHQQFYYVNTSTGERRWYLPAVPTPPPQSVQIKAEAEPQAQTPSSAPAQRIQRKAVGTHSRSVRSSRGSPTAAAQNVQANTSSVRAPLPQATDGYLPPPTVPGPYQYQHQHQHQAPQIAKPLTPAHTPTPIPIQYHQQLDFSGHFASLSLEHNQAGLANAPGGSPALYQPLQQLQPSQTTQPPWSTNDTPTSPMVNQPNAHNFSSQPANTTHFPPPPAATQYQSITTTQSPEQPAFPDNRLAPRTSQPNVASSPLLPPQPVLNHLPPPPPPPPRNPVPFQQAAGQHYAPSEHIPANVLDSSYPAQQSTTSPSPVSYGEKHSSLTPPLPSSGTQQCDSAATPGVYQPVQQQGISAQSVESFQQYAPPPPPRSLQQDRPYQQMTSPVPGQYSSPSHDPPAFTQYSFPPSPPPNVQQLNHEPEDLAQASRAVHQQYPSPTQNQPVSSQPTSASTQGTALPPPSRNPPPQQAKENHADSVPGQYTDSTGQLVYQQQNNSTSPTPPAIRNYLGTPVSARILYQPPAQTLPSPSPPSLQRYSSAPEPVNVQQANHVPQPGYALPPEPVKNPYAQQVAHANSFFGPPPRRVRTQSDAVPQRMPVLQSRSYTRAQLQVSTNQQFQGRYQAPGPNSARPPQQQQDPGQSHNQYQSPNQTQYLQTAQLQQPQNQSQMHQVNSQAQYQPHYQSQNQPPVAPQSPLPSPSNPLLPPRKSSSGMMGSMGSMGKKITGFSKAAADKSKRLSVSQPGLMKWGTRAAVGIVAVGALALGVDAVSDGSLFDAAGGGGGGGDFGGGDAAAFDSSTGSGLGGGDTGGFENGGYEGAESTIDSQTMVDANAAQLAMEQHGQENSMMLLDPVGTEYEVVTTGADPSALI